MLDNFSPEDIKVVAEKIKKEYPHITLEGSGGITINSICDYLSPYIDVFSMGCLTQGICFTACFIRRLSLHGFIFEGQQELMITLKIVLLEINYTNDWNES